MERPMGIVINVENGGTFTDDSIPEPTAITP
jgi:hypothetical protein